MIQANEIRIGNWINIQSHNQYAQIIEIKSGRPDNRDFVRISSPNLDTQFAVEISQISPIPLTEEILLKAGFEKDTGEFYLYKDITVRKTYYSDYFWRFIFKQQRIKDIKYLHDLQNTIFALTGENPVLGLKILNDAIK